MMLQPDNFEDEDEDTDIADEDADTDIADEDADDEAVVYRGSPFPSNDMIEKWIKAHFQEGSEDDLVKKSTIQNAFFQKFAINGAQSHFAVTRLGQLFKEVFKSV